MHVGEPVSEMSTCWFAGFWAGVSGTYPGSGTGTQTLESFHSYWHFRVRSAVRTTPTEIFSSMQKLFEEDWCKKFQWAERRSVLTWPDKPAMDLLNSQSLRTAGRSPAVDFWSHREKRLTGLRNYCKLWRRTDKTSAATQSKDGYTTLWAMRARKFKKEMPAEASISLKSRERGRSCVLRRQRAGCGPSQMWHRGEPPEVKRGPSRALPGGTLCGAARAPGGCHVVATAFAAASPYRALHVWRVHAARRLRACRVRQGARKLPRGRESEQHPGPQTQGPQAQS